MSVLTMPDDSEVTMSALGRLTHLCPVVDEVDEGQVKVVWRVAGETIELHSLSRYFRSWEGSTLAHEQITDRIRHDLSILSGIELIEVSTRWDTAGLEVKCSTSPIPAAQR